MPAEHRRRHPYSSVPGDCDELPPAKHFSKSHLKSKVFYQRAAGEEGDRADPLQRFAKRFSI